MKRRPVPTSINDPSVGTEEEIATRIENQKKLEKLRLSRGNLENLIHSIEELQKWGYFIDVPPGSGGDEPTVEGKIVRCDRCPQYYLVKRLEEAEKCVYHWGKPYTTRIGGKIYIAFWVPTLILMVFPLCTGEKVRVFSCCSRTSDEEGCSHGPHVFSESDPEKLHARHSFSVLPPADRSSTEKLDVAALDCEMIYTTGGSRVARVSVINGLGKEVFDHLVRMDEGIQIM